MFSCSFLTNCIQQQLTESVAMVAGMPRDLAVCPGLFLQRGHHWYPSGVRVARLLVSLGPVSVPRQARPLLVAIPGERSVKVVLVLWKLLNR